MSDLLTDFVGKSLNLPNEKIAEILYSDDGVTVKENALEELLRLDSERIKSARQLSKERESELHDKGYKKAQAETLSKFEQSLKEQFGVAESASQGLELVKDIIAKISKDTNLDDDKVKLHPLYVSLERKLGSDYVAKAEYDKLNGEFEGYKTGLERDRIMDVVKSDALKSFRALKPVLSKDPIKATNQESDFLAKLGNFDYEIQPDGSHIIKTDGRRMENSQGHPVLFSDFIKGQAEKFFDFEVQGDKGGSGNKNEPQSKTVIPQNKQEYLLAITNETDPQKRVALRNAWEASNK